MAHLFIILPIMPTRHVRQVVKAKSMQPGTSTPGLTYNLCLRKPLSAAVSDRKLEVSCEGRQRLVTGKGEGP